MWKVVMLKETMPGKVQKMVEREKHKGLMLLKAL
jgi:hypothetical protein